MAPPVKKIFSHEKPAQQEAWSKHGTAVWYIVPALEHYMCYKVFVKETRSEIIADVVEFALKM